MTQKTERELAQKKVAENRKALHDYHVLETLEAGIDYTRADGTGGSASSDTALVQHILDRPTVSLDLRLNLKLEGTANRNGFEGSATAGLFLGGRF